MPPPARSDQIRTGPDSSAKRAAQLADRIIDDVVAQGWPLGDVLGSETELLARYKVSRAVFREAVRLLEHQQVARTRRGPGGGLVITEPTADAVIDAMVLSLARADVRIDDIFEARVALEQTAIDVAPRRCTESEVARLRAYADRTPDVDIDPRVLHMVVASATRNPAIELFVDVLTRITLLFVGDPAKLADEVRDASEHAHAYIAQAVIDGDAALARRRMYKHLRAELGFVEAQTPSPFLPADAVLAEPRSEKRGEALARRITRTVLAERLPPGTLIGTERSLMEREGVSRAVLREGVRLLEYHDIARMRRGPGGGLFVVAPNEWAVTDIVATYLARHRMEVAHLVELRTAVEIALAGLAAERADDAGIARIRRALQRDTGDGESDAAESLREFHAAVAGEAHSRTLALVALVLIRLTELQHADRRNAHHLAPIRREVLQAHTSIADAIEAHDCDLARRRTQRHLDEVGVSLQNALRAT
jgi:DNA-binding FadR family transcriptional regulator